jgi:hypothetical protein
MGAGRLTGADAQLRKQCLLFKADKKVFADAAEIMGLKPE